MNPSCIATRFKQRKLFFLTSLLWFVCICISSATCNAADADNAPASIGTPTLDAFEVQQGIAGYWKVGYETQAVLRANQIKAYGWKAEIVTVDGDGVLVSHAGDLRAGDSGDSSLARMTIRHGRANRAMRLVVRDQENVVLDRELTDVERGVVLPINQPWLLALGPDLQLQEVATPSIRGGLPSITLTDVADAKQLPSDPYAFGAVTLMVLGTKDKAFIESISSEQGKAIADWVAAGGHLQVWLGSNADLVQRIDWLGQLMPGSVAGTSSGVDPSVLESYVTSNQTTRLEAFTCANLLVNDARIELSLLSAERKNLPFLVHSAHGAGTVDWIATDINSSELLAWKDRVHLLERVLDVQGLQAIKDSGKDNTAQFIGYNDLGGQIRATLDLFDRVQSGSVTLLSAFVIGFLLLIGPVDYWFFHKSLRKSAWTWFTILVCCVGLIVATQVLTTLWKPSLVVINSLEVVDYHLDTGETRGNAFVHQYSGNANRFKLTAQAQSLYELNAPENQSDTSRQDQDDVTYLRWSGKTGTGLGGFDSDVRTDVGMPQYAIVASENDEGLSSEIQGVGIPTAGTFAARASWTSDCSSLRDCNQLSNVPGSDLLQGSFTNPLTQDLLGAVIYYESWAYPLKERVKPGESMSFTIANSPRDLKRQLQQRRLVDDREQSIPWDRTARRNARRLVELLSMYDACGGKQYVGLDLRYLEEFDLSDRLQLNRAVLIAAVERPVIKWKARTDEKTEVSSDGYRTTMVRFLLPVEDR